MYQSRDSLRSSVLGRCGLSIRACLAVAALVALAAGGSIGASVDKLRPAREVRLVAGNGKASADFEWTVDPDSARETKLTAGDATLNARFGTAVEIDDGTLITDTSEWHLGAQYSDGMYRSRGNIISAEGGTPPVPEPTSALLFGLGALLVTRSVRRR